MLTSMLLAALLAPAEAADHAEAPRTAVDPAADLSDLYAWRTDDTLVVILTFGWHIPGDGYIPFNEAVLLGVHIDNDGDNLPDHDVYARFGRNGAGEVGVQFWGMPGVEGTLEGPIETALDAGEGRRAMAMLADDPFFMDLTGFVDTMNTGTLAIDSTRDSLAGTNVDAIVLELDLAEASGGSDNFQIWATSGRK
ncbi:MAG: DUF4331 domain-containing protein [Deltaproteobacteria bacterium]|nr:MAG: DUF4331 domain-containing protein [Deltaproteobacteria bacterium]